MMKLFKTTITVILLILQLLGFAGMDAKVSVSQNDLAEPTVEIETVDETIKEESEQVSVDKTETSEEKVVVNNETEETVKTTTNSIDKTVQNAPKIIFKDNRDTITMKDLNTYYIANKVYYKVIESTPLKTPDKMIMKTEYTNVEKELLTALNGSEKEFIYNFDNYCGEFITVFENNHLAFTNTIKATMFYGCPRQADGTYKLKVDLAATRNSLAQAKQKYENEVNTINQQINNKTTANAEFDKLNAKYKNKVDEAVKNAGIYNGMPVEDALVKIDAYIRSITTYDNTRKCNQFYDIFESGKSICNGYSDLFMLMARRCGIDCYKVTSESMVHSWNMVEYDGKTVYIDTTWNDHLNTNNYLLISKEKMAQDHTFNDAIITSELNNVFC